MRLFMYFGLATIATKATMLGRRNHNTASSSRSFNNAATQLSDKYQIWLSRSIYLNNCTNSEVVCTEDVNELWRPNKSSRLRMECKPCPLPEVNYSQQAKQQRAFDTNCRRASASAVMSTRCSASSIRNGLHGYLTGSRYNSAHQIDSRALNNLGMYIPRGYMSKPFEVAFGSRTHSGFNSPNAPFPVPPTSPVVNTTGVPGDGQVPSGYPVITEAIMHAPNHPDLAQVASPLVDNASATLPSQLGGRHLSTTKLFPPSFQCSTTSQVLNPEMPDSNDHTSPVTKVIDGLHHCIIGPDVQQTATLTAKLHVDIQNCSTSGPDMESHKTLITDANNSDTVKHICRLATISLNSSRSAAIVVNLTKLQTAEKEQDEYTGVEAKGSHICTPNHPNSESESTSSQ